MSLGMNISSFTSCSQTHRDGDLSQDVLGDAHALLDHLLVELVEGGVHQLHADPDVALATRQSDLERDQGKGKLQQTKATRTRSRRTGSDRSSRVF